MGINQISVHFTVSIHGQDGAVISNQGGIALLEEKAEVSIFEAKVVSSVEAKIIC